jgi:hypothetical protein
MSLKNFANTVAQQLSNDTEKESVTSWLLHSIAFGFIRSGSVRSSQSSCYAEMEKELASYDIATGGILLPCRIGTGGF